MARTKRPHGPEQIDAVRTAAHALDQWRAAEAAAKAAVLAANQAGVSTRDLGEALAVPGRTISHWCNEARHQDPPAPVPDPPGETTAQRLLKTAAAHGYDVDELERLIAALPERD